MNAREAMQALLDGKTVKDYLGYKLKIDDKGTLMTEQPDGVCYMSMILNDDLQIVEEYPLTFEEALKAMLDGKIVEPDHRELSIPYIYRLHNGVIKSKCSRWDWSTDIICEGEQLCKWKVVE